jgi:hypothetical protein
VSVENVDALALGCEFSDVLGQFYSGSVEIRNQ